MCCAFRKPSTVSAQVSTPATNTMPDRKGSKPVKSLAMKEAGAEKAAPLCGLFAEKTKAGEEYFTGYNKESDVRFCVFAQKDGSFKLTVKEKVEGGKPKYIPVCLMQEKTSKAGMKFLVGKDADGTDYLVFDKTEKEAK